MKVTIDSDLESVELAEYGRKRKQKPQEWKKNRKKFEIYSSNNKKPLISYNHSNQFCSAKKMSNEIVQSAFENFYSNRDKLSQDSILSSLMSSKTPNEMALLQFYICLFSMVKVSNDIKSS
jgi:hypothetical protein